MILQKAIEVDWCQTLDDSSSALPFYRELCGEIYANSNRILVDGIVTFTTNGGSIRTDTGSAWMGAPQYGNNSYMVKTGESEWSVSTDASIGDVQCSFTVTVRRADDEAVSILDYGWEIVSIEGEYVDTDGYTASFEPDNLFCTKAAGSYFTSSLYGGSLWDGRFVMTVSKDGSPIDRIYILFDGFSNGYSTGYLRVPTGY